MKTLLASLLLLITLPAQTWPADVRPVGTGCGLSTFYPTFTPAIIRPMIGTTWQAHVNAVQLSAGFVLIVWGSDEGPIDLGPIGLTPTVGPTCESWVNLETAETYYLMPNASGQVTWNVVIPNDLNLLGFYFNAQALVWDPTTYANAAGSAVTNALYIELGNI